MVGAFVRKQKRRIDWAREAPPVLAVAGLAADYLSPAAAWTMVLPFAFVVLLLALRKWVLAATVFLLCSWVLIPTAARAVFAVEELRGEHTVFAIDGVTLQTLEMPIGDPCSLSALTFAHKLAPTTTLPVGRGHVINPRWIMRDTLVTFAELHNLMVIERALDDAPATCNSLAPGDDAR